MAKQEEKPTERFHSVLFTEDLEFLRDRYGPGSEKAHIGISKAIRTIVHQRVQGIKAQEIAKYDQLKGQSGAPAPEPESGL